MQFFRGPGGAGTGFRRTASSAEEESEGGGRGWRPRRKKRKPAPRRPPVRDRADRRRAGPGSSRRGRSKRGGPAVVRDRTGTAADSDPWSSGRENGCRPGPRGRRVRYGHRARHAHHGRPARHNGSAPAHSRARRPSHRPPPAVAASRCPPPEPAGRRWPIGAVASSALYLSPELVARYSVDVSGDVPPDPSRSGCTRRLNSAIAAASRSRWRR